MAFLEKIDGDNMIICKNSRKSLEIQEKCEIKDKKGKKNVRGNK